MKGDKARVTTVVAADPKTAFEVFTDEIDLWWRHGPRFRVAGRRPGVLRFEGGVGGRLFESYDSAAGAALHEVGRILVWEPGARLVFEWKTSNFEPGEKTEVEVSFEATESGMSTTVTVEHRGWSAIRPDHPARHGLGSDRYLAQLGMWWADLLTSLRERMTTR